MGIQTKLINFLQNKGVGDECLKNEMLLASIVDFITGLYSTEVVELFCSGYNHHHGYKVNCSLKGLCRKHTNAPKDYKIFIPVIDGNDNNKMLCFDKTYNDIIPQIAPQNATETPE